MEKIFSRFKRGFPCFADSRTRRKGAQNGKSENGHESQSVMSQGRNFSYEDDHGKKARGSASLLMSQKRLEDVWGEMVRRKGHVN